MNIRHTSRANVEGDTAETHRARNKSTPLGLDRCCEEGRKFLLHAPY